MRRCSRCEEDKPDDVFRVRSDRRDMLHSWCRTCERAYANDKMVEAREGKKKCTSCRKWKEPYEFARNREGKLRSHCRVCDNERRREQPSTTDGVRRGQDILAARFGGVKAIPLGCFTPATSVGVAPKVCPHYAECQAREPGGQELLMCEIADSELGIPLIPKVASRIVEIDGPWWFSDNK